MCSAPDRRQAIVPNSGARPLEPPTATMREPTVNEVHEPATTGRSAATASQGGVPRGFAPTRRIGLKRLHLNWKVLVDWALWSLMGLVALRLHLQPGAMIEYASSAWALAGLSSLLRLAVALRYRLHTQSWRRASFHDFLRVARALGLAHALHGVLLLVFGTTLQVSWMYWLTDTALSAAALLGVRALSRWRAELSRRSRPGPGVDERNVVLVGADEAGTVAAREMCRHRERGLTPVAFVDDDPAKQHLVIEGVEVVGPIDALPEVIAAWGADEVVISISPARGALVRRVQELAARVPRPVSVRVMPSVFELLSGEVSISRLRPVRLEDLLRRDPVPLQLDPIRSYVAGACVMVTGAGGSIGSELVRQLTRVDPKQLVLVGCGENSLFEINQELTSRGVTTPLALVIADVSNRERMRQVFERWCPTAVFHAAAHKHVPLMETNPEEAFFNNVIGTRNVAELCADYGVERFVNVSTDKAVHPSSVMGASKRMAEAIVKEVALRPGLQGRFVSVRFGNVLGSRGSVVPVFQRQIAAGGPVKVTDPEMTRYFMTIPEACQLLLQAAVDPVHGATYLFDMGSPVRILDLAEQLIRMSGFVPYEDIAIEFTGRRPGEKLHEELTTEFESSQKTQHARINRVSATDLNGAALSEVFDHMRRLAETGQSARLRDELVALFGREREAASRGGARSLTATAEYDA